METGENWRQIVIRGVPLITAMYAVAGGAISLLGWVIGQPRLADWNNSGITMKPNAALCAMIAGSALLNSVLAPDRKSLIRTLAVIVAVLGAATLLQHLINVDLGIDTLLFHEPPDTPATASPGRMGPPASIAFLLIGVSLIFSTKTGSARRLAGWISVWVAVLSTLPLIGYLYGADQLYSFARVTGIALQTATIIAALAVGTLVSIREWGVVPIMESDESGGVMFRRLAIPIVLVALILGWLRVSGQEAGLYDTAFGTALRTIVEIALFIALLWWTSSGINKAEQKVREADRRKDEFLAVLSHELRNPLAPIRNAVEILKTAAPSERRLAEAREMIERQVGHMVRLIEDLLDVNRITRNKIELQTENVELGSLIRRSVETCRPIFVNKHQQLHLNTVSEPVNVKCDQIRLAQVFTNLLNNASKFTNPGGNVWVTLSAEGDAASISIRDDGIGIPEEKLDSIFDMFSQLDRPVGEPREGLGIGLTLTRQLVQLHGGTIVAKSDRQQPGSEFVVTLPVSAEAISERGAEPAAPAKQEEARRSILVVDDNLDSAESMSLLMKFAGNETDVSHDGLDAVKKARTMRPDAILLDIGLPLADGYEVCRAIRKESWGQDVIIVALTGWGQSEDRQRTKEAGFDAHMVKPVDPTELLKLLSEVQERRQPALRVTANL
jgi:signal transduction histidine kinase/CheY-like chemotaxis protein